MNPKIKFRKTETGLNRTHDVTVQELRAAGRFKTYTDQQLVRMIESIKKLSVIFLGLYRNKSPRRQLQPQ